MAHPRGKPKPVGDALSIEMTAGEVAVGKELALVMDGVRYSLFMDVDPPLPVNTFMLLRNIVMMRRFFAFTDAEVASRLAVTVEQLQLLTASTHYSAVDQALSDSAKRIGGLTSIDDVAKAAEVGAAKELMLMGMTASPRERIKALGDLVDRRSPKRARVENSKQTARMFPPNVIELIKLGLELGNSHATAQMLPGGQPSADSDDVIDAEVLNVPKALPSGV